MTQDEQSLRDPDEVLYRTIADYKVISEDDDGNEIEVPLDDILEVGDIMQLIQEHTERAVIDARQSELKAIPHRLLHIQEVFAHQNRRINDLEAQKLALSNQTNTLDQA